MADQLDEILVDETINEDVVLNVVVLKTAKLAAEESDIEDLFPRLVLPEIPAEVVNPGGRIIDIDKYDLGIGLEIFRTNTLGGLCRCCKNSL